MQIYYIDDNKAISKAWKTLNQKTFISSFFISCWMQTVSEVVTYLEAKSDNKKKEPC